MDGYKYSIELFYSEEDEGYIALSPELPGCSAFGETEEEALDNIKDAIQSYLETIEELGIEFKLGASPSSSLCHCEAFTLSSLRGRLGDRSNHQECPTTGIATPTARNDRKRGTPSHCHCEYKECGK